MARGILYLLVALLQIGRTSAATCVLSVTQNCTDPAASLKINDTKWTDWTVWRSLVVIDSRLEKHRDVEGDLTISDDPNLVYFPLPNYIEGNLTIWGNPKLKEIIVPKYEQSKLAGKCAVFIHANPKLKNHTTEKVKKWAIAQTCDFDVQEEQECGGSLTGSDLHTCRSVYSKIAANPTSIEKMTKEEVMDWKITKVQNGLTLLKLPAKDLNFMNESSFANGELTIDNNDTQTDYPFDLFPCYSGNETEYMNGSAKYIPQAYCENRCTVEEARKINNTNMCRVLFGMIKLDVNETNFATFGWLRFKALYGRIDLTTQLIPGLIFDPLFMDGAIVGYKTGGHPLIRVKTNGGGRVWIKDRNVTLGDSELCGVAECKDKTDGCKSWETWEKFCKIGSYEYPRHEVKFVKTEGQAFSTTTLRPTTENATVSTSATATDTNGVARMNGQSTVGTTNSTIIEPHYDFANKTFKLKDHVSWFYLNKGLGCGIVFAAGLIMLTPSVVAIILLIRRKRNRPFRLYSYVGDENMKLKEAFVPPHGGRIKHPTPMSTVMQLKDNRVRWDQKSYDGMCTYLSGVRSFVGGKQKDYLLVDNEKVHLAPCFPMAYPYISQARAASQLLSKEIRVRTKKRMEARQNLVKKGGALPDTKQMEREDEEDRRPRFTFMQYMDKAEKLGFSRHMTLRDMKKLSEEVRVDKKSGEVLAGVSLLGMEKELSNVNPAHVYRKHMIVMHSPCCSYDVVQSFVFNRLPLIALDEKRAYCEEKKIKIAESIINCTNCLVDPSPERMKKEFGREWQADYNEPSWYFRSLRIWELSNNHQLIMDKLPSQPEYTIVSIANSIIVSSFSCPSNHYLKYTTRQTVNFLEGCAFFLSKKETVMEEIQTRLPVRYVGDLRGNFDQLRRVLSLQYNDAPTHPMRQLAWVFLGNYFGDLHGFDSFMLMLAMRLVFHKRVLILRGALEFRNMYEEYRLPELLQARFGKKNGLKVLKSLNKVLEQLPLMGKINVQTMAVSAGLGPNMYDGKLPLKKDIGLDLKANSFAADCTMSCPNQAVFCYYDNWESGASYYFGIEPFQRFLIDYKVKKVVASKIITGGYGVFANKMVFVTGGVDMIEGKPNAAGILTVSHGGVCRMDIIEKTKIASKPYCDLEPFEEWTPEMIRKKCKDLDDYSPECQRIYNERNKHEFSLDSHGVTELQPNIEHPDQKKNKKGSDEKVEEENEEEKKSKEPIRFDRKISSNQKSLFQEIAQKGDTPLAPKVAKLDWAAVELKPRKRLTSPKSQKSGSKIKSMIKGVFSGKSKKGQKSVPKSNKEKGGSKIQARKKTSVAGGKAEKPK